MLEVCSLRAFILGEVRQFGISIRVDRRMARQIVSYVAHALLRRMTLSGGLGMARTIWLSLLFFAVVVPVSAEPISYNLDSAPPSIRYDKTGLLDDYGVGPGSTISGSLTLESSAIADPSNPYRYSSLNPPLGSLTLRSGALEITSSGPGGLFFISARDNVLSL